MADQPHAPSKSKSRIGVVCAAVLIFLLGSALALTWQARKTRLALAQAKAARLQAEQSLSRSEAVTHFLTGLFDASNPFTVSGSVDTTEDLLDQAVRRVDELGQEPIVQARLLLLIGKSFYARGRIDKAEPLLERALAIHRENLAATQIESDERTGRDEVGRQEDSLHAELAETLQTLAETLHDKGDLAGAEALYRESLAVRRDYYGDASEAVVAGIDGLAALLGDIGDYDAAMELTREAIATQRELGPTHDNMGKLLYRLGSLLRLEGEYEEAIPALRESIDGQRALWGPEHPVIARSMGELAIVYFNLDDPESAEPLIRESLVMKRRLLGNDHLDVAADLRTYSLVLASLERYDEAEAAAKESITILNGLYGRNHIWVAAALEALGISLSKRGDHQAAEDVFFDVLAMKKSLVGEDHPGVGRTLRNLARMEMSKGDLDAAESYYRQALDVYAGKLGSESQLAQSVRDELALLREDEGRQAASARSDL